MTQLLSLLHLERLLAHGVVAHRAEATCCHRTGQMPYTFLLMILLAAMPLPSIMSPSATDQTSLSSRSHLSPSVLFFRPCCGCCPSAPYALRCVMLHQQPTCHFSAAAAAAAAALLKLLLLRYCEKCAVRVPCLASTYTTLSL